MAQIESPDISELARTVGVLVNKLEAMASIPGISSKTTGELYQCRLEIEEALGQKQKEEIHENHLDQIRGTVVYFNDKKGYGFIFSKEIDRDIFVHYTDTATEDTRQ
uniref:CSD domain-containing protein n=1 Tax=Arion vulgaris TaxID=1028688 RepID=A0A0B7B3T4_9EUPU